MSHSVEAQSHLERNVSEHNKNSVPEYDESNKTEIKEEITSDIFNELEINAKTKCGEVFTSYSGKLVLICAFCNGKFDNMHSFGVHIREQHNCHLTRQQQIDTEIVSANPLVAKAEPEESTENRANYGDNSGESAIPRTEVSSTESQPYPNCIGGQKLCRARRNLKRQLHTDSMPDDQAEEPVKRKRRIGKKSGPLVKQPEQISDQFSRDLVKSEATQPGKPTLTQNLPSQADGWLNSTGDPSNKSPTEFPSGKYVFNYDDDSDESQGCNDPDERSSISSSETDVRADMSATETFPCNLCSRTYRSKRSLNRHLRKPHLSSDEVPTMQEWFCVSCNKQLKSRRTWQRHQRKHKLEENPGEQVSEQNDVAPDDVKIPEFHCDLCNNYFKTKFSLYIHSDAHDTLPAALQGNLDFLKCKFCNQQLPKYAERKKHEKTHTGARPYECPYCEKGFSSNYDRKIHIRSHTGEFQFECPHCPKVCTNKTDLKRHVVRHLNIRNFGCELCDKRFYRPFELARHMRTHTKERPYVCEDCGATYPVLAQLKDHQLRHKGVKNIKCEICGRLFYSKSVLKVHMPTHFDEKPFECDVCGRKFSRAKAMQKHQKLHSGEKKYVCNICGKAYAQDSGLYAHKKTHGANVA